MSKLSKTSYGRKIIFNDVLSAELGLCKLKIDAFYKWMPPQTVMSAWVSENKTVHLGINIAFENDKLFAESNKAAELTILYRTYYIASYIKRLEAAYATEPATYFAGLVTLEAVIDLCARKKLILDSPLADGKIKNLRPINVQCAIGALTRLLIEHDKFLENETKSKCEKCINELINYTMLPETEYENTKHPGYAVLRDMAGFRKLTKEKADSLNEFSLFKNIGTSLNGTATLKEILIECEQKENKFWSGVVLRMAVFAKDKRLMDELVGFECIRTAISDFYFGSVEYFKAFQNDERKLYRDNWHAIKKLASLIERHTINKEFVFDGAVHYVN